MQANIIEIKSQEDWQQKVLSNPLPVIVDFYADWCGPCKKLKPTLHTLVGSNQGKWQLATLNVDIQELGSVSGKYANQGIPAVYLFNKGQVVSQFLGNNAAEAQNLAAKAAQL